LGDGIWLTKKDHGSFNILVYPRHIVWLRDITAK